jgi:periplasmic divalent cation tolerance protein
MENDLVVVQITVGDQAEAERVARALLEARLAACVNMLPGVASLYWWEGKIERSEELLLLVKTRHELVGRLVEAVRAVHSYQVFDTVAMPIIDGSKDYLEWVRSETSSRGDAR